MINKWTYAKKNRLMNIIAVVLLFVVWQMGIKKTLEIRESCVEAEQQAEQLKDVPHKMALLEYELKDLKGRLGAVDVDSTEEQQKLLELLTNYCQKNGTVLREFPQTESKAKGDMTIQTKHFMVQGSFDKLLRLVYILEQKQQVGKVASVQYCLQKERTSRKTVLVASIYIQNLNKGT